MFGRKPESHTPDGVPILCLFHKEDGVWNAAAAHIPVAVFGDTFEEAKENLCNAIVCHIESVAETGNVEQLFEVLRKRAQDHMLMTEIREDSFIGKMAVTREMVCA